MSQLTDLLRSQQSNKRSSRARRLFRASKAVVNPTYCPYIGVVNGIADLHSNPPFSVADTASAIGKFDPRNRSDYYSTSTIGNDGTVLINGSLSQSATFSDPPSWGGYGHLFNAQDVLSPIGLQQATLGAINGDNQRDITIATGGRGKVSRTFQFTPLITNQNDDEKLVFFSGTSFTEVRVFIKGTGITTNTSIPTGFNPELYYMNAGRNASLFGLDNLYNSTLTTNRNITTISVNSATTLDASTFIRNNWVHNVVNVVANQQIYEHAVRLMVSNGTLHSLTQNINKFEGKLIGSFDFNNNTITLDTPVSNVSVYNLEESTTETGAINTIGPVFDGTGGVAGLTNGQIISDIEA